MKFEEIVFEALMMNGRTHQTFWRNHKILQFQQTCETALNITHRTGNITFSARHMTVSIIDVVLK